jgi:hypothetical protein
MRKREREEKEEEDLQRRRNARMLKSEERVIGFQRFRSSKVGY